jgi:polysaccharide deacetylase family protein (PEP-CTERM system associated)
MTQTSLIQSPPDASLTGEAPVESASKAGPRDVTKRHILTVGLEDWFHVGAFQQLIEKDQWYRFETRLERSTQTVLELLDRYNTKATFFVLGWVAERMPELIAEVADRGHEIASRGFYHRNIRDLSREEFRDDLARTREVLEAAAGHRVIGHRIADGWFGEDDLWTLDVLAKDGYAYDSSVLPMFRSFSGEPHRRFVHQHDSFTGPIWEVPPSTWELLGFRVPIAGGNWFRQIPHTILSRAVDAWHRNCEHPFVMYFHTWEFDPEQPRVSAVDRVNKVRHYRNLDKMRWVLEDYLTKYRFGTVANSLGIELEPLARKEGKR